MGKSKKVPHKEDANQAPAKRYIMLHFTPKAIQENIKDILLEYRKMENPPQQLIDLFTDIEALVAWALARLPMVPPPAQTKE